MRTFIFHFLCGFITGITCFFAYLLIDDAHYKSNAEVEWGMIGLMLGLLSGLGCLIYLVICLVNS